jgi:hypothetical protein
MNSGFALVSLAKLLLKVRRGVRLHHLNCSQLQLLLLETGAAEYWPALGGLEGHRRFRTAL